MRGVKGRIACFLVLAATFTLAAAAAAALPAQVTLHGVGGVTPGMGAGEVEQRWGLDLELQTIGPGSDCATAAVHRGGMAGYAIFFGERFQAVWLDKGAVTARGIRIGSSVSDLRRAYGGALTSRANKYTTGAKDYFVRRARAPRWQLRFDVSPGGLVTVIGFGNKAVRLVEGCA